MMASCVQMFDVLNNFTAWSVKNYSILRGKEPQPKLGTATLNGFFATTPTCRGPFDVSFFFAFQLRSFFFCMLRVFLQNSLAKFQPFVAF